MENHNDCVNNSTVVNYYHRLGFPCTEALYVSSTHFRLLIVPQKSFSKESPIFKPAEHGDQREREFIPLFPWPGQAEFPSAREKIPDT